MKHLFAFCLTVALSGGMTPACFSTEPVADRPGILAPTAVLGKARSRRAALFPDGDGAGGGTGVGRGRVCLWHAGARPGFDG